MKKGRKKKEDLGLGGYDFMNIYLFACKWMSFIDDLMYSMSRFLILKDQFINLFWFCHLLM